jgi:hypothetical protein
MGIRESIHRALAEAQGQSAQRNTPPPTKAGKIMSEKFQFTSGLGRGSNDFYPSAHELYFKHFDDNIYFVYHTGITDRYNSPAYDEDDEDDDEMPNLGLENLEKEIKGLMEVTEKYSAYGGQASDELATIYKFANYENNVFVANVVFVNKTLVQIRISPTRRRTMTAFTILSDNFERPELEVLKTYAKQFIAPPPTKKDKIHIITQSNNDFYLKDIPLTSKKKSMFSFENYNEGFEDISNRIINTLKTDSESGLVLFHGDPGTGKTSYLKHLLHTIDSKKLIYMPPDLTEHLSSPGFITFMMSEATNSILLIEDAENVLRHREAGGNQAVSNILNLSDGILGDVLKLQIVCTFNSKLEEIDPALLRPGRCIAEYRFEPLAADRAYHLMQKLHGDDIENEGREMTLAEVFNYRKPKDRTKSKKQKLGFT